MCEAVSVVGGGVGTFTPFISERYIPDPSSMNIGKLGIGGALTSDTCNGARKMCRLISDQFHEAG